MQTYPNGLLNADTVVEVSHMVHRDRKEVSSVPKDNASKNTINSAYYPYRSFLCAHLQLFSE